MSSQSAPTVIAIGGHSLLDPDLPPTMANQFEVTREAMRPIADLLERRNPNPRRRQPGCASQP